MRRNFSQRLWCSIPPTFSGSWMLHACGCVWKTHDLLPSDSLPQIPRNLEFTWVPKEFSIHCCQQKGLQFTACPYTAEFVQSFSLYLKKAVNYTVNLAMRRLGRKGFPQHTPCTWLFKNSLTFGSKHTVIKGVCWGTCHPPVLPCKRVKQTSPWLPTYHLPPALN